MPLARFFVFLYLLLQILSGCASYLVVSGGEVNRAKLEEIKTGVEDLRGLKFAKDVPVVVENKEGMKRYFEADLARDYGDEKLRNMALAYSKLGLLPNGFDLKKSLLDFYSAQVAAFYDPVEKKLVLPEDLNIGAFMSAVQFVERRDIGGEMILAHELTHALQDQHFSLEERLRPSSNDDKTLAFHAVAEGDATLSGFGYLLGIDDKSLSLVNQTVQASIKEGRSAFPGVPDAIIEELLFQYYGGVSFVSRVLREKGWSGVNLLYESPPLSTEQVLHPEKFFDKADPPIEIVLKDLSRLFSSDWERIEDNVLGELMVRVLFREFVPEKEAETVAEGWGGDRFVAFRRGNKVSFIWATVWDSVKDAEEYEQNYRGILSKKYAGLEQGGSEAYIERRDRRVVVVEGLEKSYVQDNIDKIWQSMELREASSKGR